MRLYLPDSPHEGLTNKHPQEGSVGVTGRNKYVQNCSVVSSTYLLKGLSLSLFTSTTPKERCIKILHAGYWQMIEPIPYHFTDDKTDIQNHKKVCVIAKTMSAFLFSSQAFFKGGGLGGRLKLNYFL